MKVRFKGDYETVTLDFGKIYTVLSIEKGWYRIMSELDEDYLFHPEDFEIVEPDDGSVPKK